MGAGESGKSTFLKQMRIIHGYRFDQEELSEYKQTIYRNLILGMKVSNDLRMLCRPNYNTYRVIIVSNLILVRKFKDSSVIIVIYR